MNNTKPIELNNKNIKTYVKSLLPRIPSLNDRALKISSVEEVTEQTYVNYIFKATISEKGEAFDIYIRQSRDHVKAAPGKKYDASRISYETAILDLLDDLKQDLVPEVLYLDIQNNVAVLADIKRDCPLLVNELVKGRAHPETGSFFGETIALLHGETYGISNRKVRGNKKENEAAVDFHLGMRLDPAQEMQKKEVENLLKEGKNAKQCLVLGDLASKNIFVDGKKIRFLDLERSFIGDPAFDPAFLFCHYLIEVKPENLSESLKFIDNFMKAYKKVAGKYLTKDELERFESRVIRYLGITILYRLFGFYLVVNVERQKELWAEIARELLKEGTTHDLPKVLYEKANRF